MGAGFNCSVNLPFFPAFPVLSTDLFDSESDWSFTSPSEAPKHKKDRSQNWHSNAIVKNEDPTGVFGACSAAGKALGPFLPFFSSATFSSFLSFDATPWAYMSEKSRCHYNEKKNKTGFG